MLKFLLKGAGVKAGLLATSPNGEALVRPYDYSTPIFQNLDVDDQVYNFFAPEASQQFIVTDIIAFANRNVTTQTQLDIYEATAADSATIAKQILRLDLAKLTGLTLIGMNLKVSEGVFVNAKCDDDDVLLTIAGYYIPVIK